MGFVLFIVALVLTGFVFAINIVVQPVYYVVTFKWKSGVKQLDKWLYKMSLSVDQFGAVSCGVLLTLLFVKKGGIAYGKEEDDTASYVTAQNKQINKLTKLGKGLGWVLDFVDKDHLDKAINNKIIKDKEAAQRVKENRYFTLDRTL